jgi:prepilin-type processing-associated H-X9-DG protein
MQAMFHSGHKFLCDGYVIEAIHRNANTLILNIYLCDGHVILI